MEEQTNPSNIEGLERLEERLRQYAHTFTYPATPVWQRSTDQEKKISLRKKAPFLRLLWGIAIAFVLLTVLFSVPSVRAQILEFIQIGVIRIFLVEPTAAATTTTPAPTSTLLPSDLVQSLQDLAGEISLSDAPNRVNFSVLLPDYPTGIGEPQHVFVQNIGKPVLILIWMDPDHPDQVLFSLSTIPPGSYAMNKSKPSSIQDTTVSGQPAIWASGPYILQYLNGDVELRRLVDGSSLIWAKDGITNRLETGLPMAEAVNIAESLKPYSP